MSCRECLTSFVLSFLLSSAGLAAPLIDPIANVTIPAGKSLIVPVTATSPTGQPLTYTVTSSTNGIAVVMHTNNPFWQLSMAQVADTNAPGAYQTPFRGGMATVTNVGNLTFMLFPEYAPHTIKVFQGLTTAGFYNSNTIFHRVITNFMIQGGDPLTNGTGRLVFTYDDEFNPQAMFSGNGQLALANRGKDTDGSQFFVTVGPQRSLDFGYPIFGQLVRGFEVLTNLINTAVDTNNRPLADEIIQTASYVPNTADTVLTLIGTNVPGVAGTITVIADDGAGGRTTNVFAATLVTDTNSNNQPFIYPNTVTNLVGPVNRTLTNFVNAVELSSDTLYWFPAGVTDADYTHVTNSSYTLFTNVLRTLTYNVTNVNGRLQLFLVPPTNYAGPISVVFDVSYSGYWSLYQQYGLPLPNYDQQVYTFVFGDTPISGQSKTVTALASVPFNNALLATFTNGVPGSSSASFTAAINWGDNSTNSGVVTANAAGEKAVLGSHAYEYPGSYPVYVQIQSAIGASATVLSFVTVTNEAAAETNLLTVQVTGPGTVSPDYSNALLAVGGSYSIGAIPADLAVLASWTDGNGFVLGTGTNLVFTMYPGLRLTANFALATPPSLTIVSPSSGQLITNLYSAPATVTGTAANNATVTSVWYQVNSNGWQEASGTTNWTARFIPTYGVTNRFQAYAVNNYGYVSTTNTVSARYLAGDVLTVNTNGLGRITPVLSGQLLPLGSNYVLTATPASGFVFGNWTGSLLGSNAVLSFTMATNMALTANFVDKTKPVVAITNLVNGQRLIYAVFTVRGTASDNWQVTNVWLKLNGGNWTDAVTANNYTNWSGSLNLIEGTNTLSVYAVDMAGMTSTTNSVSFTYVVSAPLQVQMMGRGTLSPNYSNTWLAINQPFSMTATPGTGFVFTNWTGGTSLPLVVLTNGRTVRFSMTSNLTLQANFVDTSKPVVTITNVVSGQRVSNAVFTVKGKATDNWQVSNVWYQLNNAGWNLASSSNNWANWTAEVTLVPGTNTVRAYALDTSGNPSLTNSVSFTCVLSDRLRIMVSGRGTLSPNYSNAALEIEKSYTMTATAASGYAFTNWVISTNWLGGRTTNTPILQFLMQSNLTLQANFSDVTRPTNAIISPKPGQQVNAVITATGTASDNAQVAAVKCQLNSNAWAVATGTTNWSAVMVLLKGTNVLRAYALDASGNTSATNLVTFVSTNDFQMALSFGSAHPLTDTGLDLCLQLTPGLSCRVESSTNMVFWTTFTNFVGTNVPLYFRDVAAPNYTQRFYRAVTP